ncbi:superoxide dismutase [Cu-Zn] [Mycobacterium kubicae]|uniref:Superoxide dismutase [Cu-Zn] n=1 Tax=Mycobacterium kubicae TaxID=120959 RepID=A0AAX1JDU9_9MYCO|nr:superoxide dismutase family protein [Mycobacterium kubicae]MCV7095093.1 superoxide dismutase family protein [Mycobacterium kubicae]OBF24391.1 superoxide dismutase [Mycobacterium kubicae]OBK43884.1 superoxide dismutase [Mycobacterium kubicae]ORV97105.1 superoxide dismutase [Mycobacterium kubicae]QNI05477.1 superoxide dismutase [Mycobacterium kubicae]
MPMPAGHRTFVAALSAAASVALFSACTSPQHPATSPGSTPPVWTGSPAPSGAGSGHEGGGHHDGGQPAGQADGQGNGGGNGQTLTTRLNGPNGTEVATAKFEFANGYATVTITTSGPGKLSPGFHGVHIHQIGKCEPNSVAPTGGAPGDFLSAGGHFHGGGHGAGQAGGDLTSLQVRGDGTGMLVTTTDAFTMDDLTNGQKTAIIIHAGADNFANIPSDRYNQANGTPGPDETTMTTGDAGKRVACGVNGSG